MSDIGKGLIPVFDQMFDWGVDYLEHMNKLCEDMPKEQSEAIVDEGVYRKNHVKTYVLTWFLV